MIFDYAWHEWGGLLGDYYRGRWEKFHAMLADRMARGETWTEAGLPLNMDRPDIKAKPFYNELYEWEKKWIRGDKSYDSDSVGDSLATAKSILEKYKSFAEVSFSVEGRKVWAERQNRVRDVRLATQFGKRVWSWGPELMTGSWMDVEFDITEQLTSGTEFKLSFVREKGGELKISKIIVEQDGAPISRDEHEGYTGRGGNKSEKNVYTFRLPMVVPNAKYVGRATLFSEPGAKSAGTAWLKEND